MRKNKWERPEAFAFDTVLPVDASQRRVYEAVCAPVVEAVMAGFNGAVLAYGQTGTGKTHTLLNLGKGHGADARGNGATVSNGGSGGGGGRGLHSSSFHVDVSTF